LLSIGETGRRVASGAGSDGGQNVGKDDGEEVEAKHLQSHREIDGDSRTAIEIRTDNATYKASPDSVGGEADAMLLERLRQDRRVAVPVGIYAFPSG